MARKLRLGNVVLCEHAVQGAGNKHTLVGVFAGDILVESFPAVLTVGLYAEVLKETPITKLDVTFLLNGNAFAKLVAAYQDPTAGIESIVLVPLLQIGVQDDSVFEIVMEAEGYAKIVALRKTISLNPAPRSNLSSTVLPPPPAQSQPASRPKAKKP